MASWESAFVIWICDLAIFFQLYQNWQNLKEKGHHLEQIALGVILGIYGLNLFIFLKSTLDLSMLYSSVILIGYLATFIILGLFLLPQIFQAKKQKIPLHQIKHSYAQFLENPDQNSLKFLPNPKKPQSNLKMKANHEKKDFVKEITRKELHFLFFIGLGTIYLLFYSKSSVFPTQNISGKNFCFFLYFLIAGIIGIYLILGDFCRIYAWDLLPAIAKRFYHKGIHISREGSTFIASIPMLFSIMIWAVPWTPIAVLFLAAWNSCISDSISSIIGKMWGKHHITQIGRHPHKTWEGLITGLISAGLGPIFLSLLGVLSRTSIFTLLGLILISLMVYGIIDLYGHFVVDNLTIPFWTGALSWIWLTLV